MIKGIDPGLSDAQLVSALSNEWVDQAVSERNMRECWRPARMTTTGPKTHLERGGDVLLVRHDPHLRPTKEASTLVIEPARWGIPTSSGTELTTHAEASRIRLQMKTQAGIWRERFLLRRAVVPTSWYQQQYGVGFGTTPDQEPMYLASVWQPTKSGQIGFAVIVVPTSEDFSPWQRFVPVIVDAHDAWHWMYGQPREVLNLMKPLQKFILLNPGSTNDNGDQSVAL